MINLPKRYYFKCKYARKMTVFSSQVILCMDRSRYLEYLK